MRHNRAAGYVFEARFFAIATREMKIICRLIVTALWPTLKFGQF
jgi:hypothetical protein